MSLSCHADKNLNHVVILTKLKIHNFRNINEKELSFHNNVNVFYGKNGSGKTSILEAIHFVSSGKSFRKGKNSNLINYEENDLTVYLEAHIDQKEYKIGVNKTQSKQWKARINERKINKQSEITKLIPVVSIDPEVYRLVDYGPIYRRNFLDWLVFHVKHDYLFLWKQTHRCIKQLNVLYKKKKHFDDIDYWEENLITYSLKLTEIREQYFNSLKPRILSLLKQIQPEIQNITLDFKKGWSKDITLSQQLKLDRKRNLKFGALQHGPHKTDILIQVSDQSATHTLSRGQKKTLSIVFYLAYIQVLEAHNIKPVLCLDDLDAELDDEKLSTIAGFFSDTGLQMFITSVQEKKITQAFPKAKMFHVEHLQKRIK